MAKRKRRPKRERAKRAGRFEEKRRQASCQNPGNSCVIDHLGTADSWVEKRVGNLGDEHRQHQECAKKTGEADDHRVVAPMDAVDHPLPESRDGKDPLDHETARKDLGDDRAEVGDDRQDRIAKAMVDRDPEEREPLG